MQLNILFSFLFPALAIAQCGSLSGVDVGPIEIDEASQNALQQVDLQGTLSQSFQLTWENNNVDILSSEYKVLLSADGGATHNLHLTTIKSAPENATIHIRTVDICPERFCCRAFSAECMSCIANESVEEFCAKEENKHVIGCGPTIVFNSFCCQSNNVDCLACAQGKTVQEICSANPETSGCEEIEATEKFCCFAYTAKCLSCAANMSEKEFCQSEAGDGIPGCYIPVTTSLMLKSTEIMGCAKTAVVENIQVLCPKYDIPQQTLDSSRSNDENVAKSDTKTLLTGAGIGASITFSIGCVAAFVLKKRAIAKSSDGMSIFEEFKVEQESA